MNKSQFSLISQLLRISNRMTVCAIIVIALVVAACNGNGAKSVDKNDSLFLGFTLGMERQAFFDRCWEYNKQKLFTHSPTNREVEYKMVEGLNAPVSMRFYPSFHENKIYEMPVTFSYEAWAPWNRQYKSDSLLARLVPTYEKWYGKLQVTNHAQMGTVYYRMDGKRRINIYIKDDQFVRVVFTDMKVEKEIEKLEKQETGG